MLLRISVFSICSLITLVDSVAVAQAPLPGGRPQALPVKPATQPAANSSLQPNKTMDSTKRAKPAETSMVAGAYSSVEMLHTANRYENAEDAATRQESFTQFRLVLGYQFQSGLDLYATLGAIKLPDSQQLVVRRPEIEADFYLARVKTYDFLGYMIHKLPWSDDQLDHELSLPHNHGSETVVGIKATVGNHRIPTIASMVLIGGADVWTKFYSRKQYATAENHETDEFLLIKTPEGEVIEDRQQHVFSELHAGAGYVPSWLPDFSADASAFVRRDFEPSYPAEKGEDPRYGAENTSYYRLRISHRFSKTVEFNNDFFHFHRGFFAARTLEYDRRYRNLAKITYKF